LSEGAPQSSDLQSVISAALQATPEMAIPADAHQRQLRKLAEFCQLKIQG
jgi:hypothetical protein